MSAQDISLRISSLAPPRGQQSYPLRISSPLPLPQLSSLLNLLNQALDIIDISTWTGDPKNGSFISGQLRLLADTIDEAKTVMKGGEDIAGGKWWEDDFASDEMIFAPPLPPNLSPHLTLTPTSLLLTIRTLQPSPSSSTPNPSSTPTSTTSPSTHTGLSLRTRLTQILAPMPVATHDEADRVFVYRGQEVKVRDKVRVESQDPSLMAVGAKLSAVGHAVEGWRYKLGVVMEQGMEDD
ncbi:MAG: hypothetical protein LQ338_000635 [Usnochroma carphineum]|nr:MAG: hypothetical protein LQ338_000635 [Usnochroma carphineum]